MTRPARCVETRKLLSLVAALLPLVPTLLGCGQLLKALGGDLGEGDDGPVPVDQDQAAGWTALEPIPCGFNRVDAFHIDIDGTLWAGCGTNTEGTGLYVSTDDGGSWSGFEAAGAARSFFDSFRVNTISRSSDGKLYVGGTSTTSNARVVGLDDAGNVSPVIAADGSTGTSFSVGHFRRDSTGRAVAESLTGADVLVRGSDEASFFNAAATLFTDGRTHQIQDLTLDGDTFHAVGSTMTEPNLYFREVAPRGGNPLTFEVIDLSSTGVAAFPGELRGVAVSAGVVVVGGVNEDADEAVFYRLEGDQSTLFFAADVRPSLRASVVRGVCSAPGHFVIVGDEPLAGGAAFLFHSTDGMQWDDLTDELPENPGSLSRCIVQDDTVFAAGAGGAVFRGVLSARASSS